MKRKLVYLKETTDKIFRFDGTNQNTLDAWIRVDAPEEENIDVNIKDENGSHVWHRKKSNDNVRGKVEDGKGFSFFFARYAYLDKLKYNDESLVKNPNPNYKAFTSSIPFKILRYFDEIKNDKRIMSRLDPKNEVLLVIYEDNRIISATYTKDEAVLLNYIKNRSEKLIERDLTLDKESWLREKSKKQQKKYYIIDLLKDMKNSIIF
ncbi:MAG: hypothetical protein LBG43_00650 [Treponema sp.]|nr:hypothetical protein [Treponema sp.]